MKRVILDTNFILTCIKQKIDFFDDIKIMGLEILIPEEVLYEIKKIASSKKKFHFREDAKFALMLLKQNKEQFKKIKISNENVDEGIKKFAEENKDIIVATLDKELKEKLMNKKLIIKGKKKLEII